MATQEEIEERRAKRRAELAKVEKEQFEKDLEALDELEIEHGHGTIGSAKTAHFVPGLPTRVFFRTPKGPEYTRYTEQYGRATDKKSTAGQRDALTLLGKTCWLYPKDDDTKKALAETFPGLLVSVGLAASKKAEAETEAEGKE
jgi:hypothetical protein